MSAALVAPMPCADQAELLRAFDLPIALDAGRRGARAVTAELVETKAADGVRYLEIRWGPLLHVARGLVARRRDRGGVRRRAGRGGAGPGTVVRLICTALRSHDPAANVALAETAARFRDQGLTGFDLAGPEEALPGPARARAGVRGRPRGGPADHPPRRASGAARRRSAARSTLEPERIAHGPGAVDDPALCAELIARGVTLDLCPTSNWQAGIVPSRRGTSARPPPSGRRAGHALARTTRPSRDITLSEEYRQRGRDHRADRCPELWAIDRHALDVAFADEMASRRCAPRSTSGRAIPELVTGAA